jgi:predicted kinase
MARDLVMVNGLPGSGKSTLGPRLANALGAAYLSKDRIKEALADAVVSEVPALGPVAMDTAYALAGSIDGMVVLDSWWFRPRDLEFARRGLERTGATALAEVWCDVPAAVARTRVLARQRPDHIYHDADRLAVEWPRWAAEAEPLALGPVIRVDTTAPVDLGALCTQLKAALWVRPAG